MADTALSTVPEQQVAKRFGRMVARSADVIDVVDATHTLKRDPGSGRLIRPPGMDDATWNLHCDAMKSNKNVPVYLAEHYKRMETAQKIAGLRGAEAPPLAGYVVHVVERKTYPVVDVTVSKEE